MWVRRGLLWALVEALTDKREGRCVLPGRLGEDVAALAEPLKLTRNAVFHIPRPREPYPDTRLVALMTGTESGARVKRVHDGLGRLIGDELNQRPEYRSGEGRALSGSVEAGDGLRVAVRRFADADPVEVDVNAEVTSPLVRLDRPR